MGLDQYMYVRMTDEGTNTESEPRQLAYRRKHGDLHGWMQKLYAKKTGTDSPDDFNGVELELDYEDIKSLENTVRHKQLPHTEGFFFGSGNTDQHFDEDLQFCVDAKAEIFLGFRVFYNSSW